MIHGTIATTKPAGLQKGDDPPTPLLTTIIYSLHYSKYIGGGKSTVLSLPCCSTKKHKPKKKLKNTKNKPTKKKEEKKPQNRGGRVTRVSFITHGLSGGVRVDMVGSDSDATLIRESRCSWKKK